MKAATFDCKTGVEMAGISIHAAREGGDINRNCVIARRKISIHAAREGGDGKIDKILYIFRGFQSTPPVKAATQGTLLSVIYPAISIHAAREGGDPLLSGLHCSLAYFNPRRP